MLMNEELTKRDIESGAQARQLLTVREVAHALCVHPNTVRRWANKGIIRAYRINQRGDRRFRSTDVGRFLAALNDRIG